MKTISLPGGTSGSGTQKIRKEEKQSELYSTLTRSLSSNLLAFTLTLTLTLTAQDSIPSGYYKRFTDCSLSHPDSSFICDSKTDLLFNGGLVMDNPDLEHYLNSILIRVLPDSLKNGRLRVFAIRNWHYKPFHYPDGTILIPLRVIASLESEAALAVLLAHQVAHYFFRDSPPRLNTGKFLADKGLGIVSDVHEDSRREIRADSLACILASDAGYHPSAGINSLFAAYYYPSVTGKDLYTGPRLTNAVPDQKKISDPLEYWLSANKTQQASLILYQKAGAAADSSNAFFLLDTSLFRKHKKEALIDLLEYLLEEQEYFGCCYMAFSAHLSDNDEMMYIYYICESIRRRTLTQSGIIKKNFLGEILTGNYRNKTVLHNLAFLIPDSVSRKKITRSPLLDTSDIKFKTYGEAFVYFSAIGEKKLHPPALLSKALMNYKNGEEMNRLLQLYIQQPGSIHKQYAEALMEEKLSYAVTSNTRKVIYVMEPENTKGPYGMPLVNGEEEMQEFQSVFQRQVRKELPGTEIYFSNQGQSGRSKQQEYNRAALLLSNHYRYDPVTYRFWKDEQFELTRTSIDSSMAYGRDIFLLDPWLWEFFEKENLRSLTVTEVRHHDEYQSVSKAGAWYFPLYWIIKLPQYVRESVWGSSRHSFSVTSFSFQPGSKWKSLLYSSLTYKKMRKPFLENELMYSFKHVGGNKKVRPPDRNFGFKGKMNELKFDLVTAIHNGIYGASLRRSVGRFFSVYAGYSVISKSGEFGHTWTDSLNVEHHEQIRFGNFGTQWKIGVLWTSGIANIPAPIGMYGGLEFERTGNEFFEWLDTAASPYNYQHRRICMKFTAGTNYYLGSGFTFEFGLETGLSMGSVLPMNSSAAYRVPVRQYPDHYVWNLKDPFSYYEAASVANGTGSTAFATFRLRYLNLWFYPSVKAGFMF